MNYRERQDAAYRELHELLRKQDRDIRIGMWAFGIAAVCIALVLALTLIA
jgi:hypothetical protein